MKEVTAKGFLKRIRKLDKMIMNKIAEKEQWKAIATGTTVQLSERVQTSSNGQKMENAIINALDIQADIDRYISKLAQEKKEVISVIEQLNEIHYDVLHKIYVQNFTFQKVADDYGKSYSWATSIHGRALKNLQNILDERNGSECKE